MLRSSIALPLALSLALAGCGGQHQASGDDYTIFAHDASLLPRGGDDALVSGRLLTRNGCVLLEHSEGTAYPVIWPAGTSISSEDPLTLRLASAAEITVGQVISGGGGYHQASSDVVTVDIPAECVPATGEVAMFNPDADLSVDEG